jgi:hypothetical protein
MRKSLAVLVALILSLPAWASVAITCTDEGSGVIAVRYNNTEAHNLRGFALDISIDSGQTFTAASNFNTSYNVAPGSYVSQTNLGNPVCDATRYAGTLGGLGTNGVTIEMASLYAPGQPAPPKSGVLCRLTTSTGCGTVTLTGNTIRRGPVVMEDPTESPAVTLTGVTIGAGCCGPVCVSCLGDIDFDGDLDADDVFLLVSILEPYADQDYWIPLEDHCEWACFDFYTDGALSADDVFLLIDYLSPYADQDYWTPCP